MWTFGFFLSLVRNTGPVDGSFAQNLHYCFVSPLLELLWQQEPDLPYTQVLLSGLSAAASFCSVPRRLRSVFTWGKTQPFPTRAVFARQICAISFAFDARSLWQATLIRGRKTWVHNKKLKKQNKASGKRKGAWERRRCEHRGWKQRPATHRAMEPVAPSFVVFFVARVLKLWYSSRRPSTSL